ncbi:ferrous iron transport protein B [Thiorhodospira sibirica]|uniref:ferrous iron transport protein B n=1 Tax=Thiorhodospira sibirica TaxID=154347 RepID=UPI00022C596D|nr:ferrous iron transport protein B [Thiorhodospira sibirica]
MSAPDAPAIALIGQPNCGKSTLFNELTGLSQHIANYPGVTVEKKTGYLKLATQRLPLVDLPGTYSLTAFSPEERVVRQYLLNSPPRLSVNVLDASQLRRSLSLTLQVLEMGLPLVCVLNMSDVARRHQQAVDARRLAELLGVSVVETVGRRGEGLEQLKQCMAHTLQQGHTEAPYLPDYGPLEAAIRTIQQALPAQMASRWRVLRLLEGDQELQTQLHSQLKEAAAPLLAEIKQQATAFTAQQGISVGDHIIIQRDRHAREIEAACIASARPPKVSFSERVDRVLLHRAIAPVVLLATVYLIYYASIVQGYELTHYTWPLLSGIRNQLAEWLPAAGFLYDPLSRSFSLWLVDSVNTLLNYVPIFLILFALIAILEDSGYMARIAFILDRILHRFGLHGQSTLPFILGGVFAGGCAVPGVMATRAIPDPRARLATILTVPYMNCLAKVPLYTLLISIFFVEHKALMMFFIATITVMVALLVARLLTFSILRPLETVPFVMEMPRYHLPTVQGVVRRSLERTWLYVKKVGTVVLAVAVVIFVLLNLPGLSADERAAFEQRANSALQTFYAEIADNPHAARFQDADYLLTALNLAAQYRARRMNLQNAEAIAALDQRFQSRYPEYFAFIRPGGGDRDVRAMQRSLRTLDQERRMVRLEMQETRIVNSLLGRVGRALEPVTQAAGFDWKINVALLSSFAARESSVATLGVLFQAEEGSSQTLEQRMGGAMQHADAALVALSLIIFFALYPPCLATAIMVRIQTASTGWMVFSVIFPTVLGLLVASAIYTTGVHFALDAVQMMMAFWLLTLALLLIIGLWPTPRPRPPVEPTHAH